MQEAFCESGREHWQTPLGSEGSLSAMYCSPLAAAVAGDSQRAPPAGRKRAAEGTHASKMPRTAMHVRGGTAVVSSA